MLLLVESSGELVGPVGLVEPPLPVEPGLDSVSSVGAPQPIINPAQIHALTCRHTRSCIAGPLRRARGLEDEPGGDIPNMERAEPAAMAASVSGDGP
ncbi:MAG: hypothetical protein AAGF11_26800 [Myxococcota bacterium]